MPLTRSEIEEQVTAYRDEEPLYAVEVEQIQTLGEALKTGDYGWRDVVWIVQWYYRRHLGAYPDEKRREREDSFADNDFGMIRETLAAVTNAEELEQQIDRLTQLSGVDVGVASAILMFVEPASYLSVGEREWRVLHQQGELETPPGEAFTVADYRTYLATCRSIAARAECSLWTLYQAIWRLSRTSNEPRDS